MRDGLPPTTKEMHPFFESLVVTGAPGLQAFLMDIHHETSFRSILEDESISLASRSHICSCSSKGVGLWLVTRPSIHSFRIAHCTLTSMLHFRLNLIQPLASSLLTCKCGHELDASSMHLVRCSFGG
jgi:hypothetical protein